MRRADDRASAGASARLFPEESLVRAGRTGPTTSPHILLVGGSASPRSAQRPARSPIPPPVTETVRPVGPVTISTSRTASRGRRLADEPRRRHEDADVPGKASRSAMAGVNAAEVLPEDAAQPTGGRRLPGVPSGRRLRSADGPSPHEGSFTAGFSPRRGTPKGRGPESSRP